MESPDKTELAHKAFDAGDFATAQRLYREIAADQPTPALLVNLGYCLVMQGHPHQAEHEFRAALRIEPRKCEALIGLGDSLAAQGRHDTAVSSYDAALEISPGAATARNNRSQSLLAVGRLREAWRDAEARYELPLRTSLYPHQPALPLWSGDSGKRVWVHWEQGFGDIIQHLRFLPEVRARSLQAAFECPLPFLRLAERQAAWPSIVRARKTPPETAGFDAYAPLASLPLLLGTDPERLTRAPYLAADAAMTMALRDQWTRSGQALVGITWRGGAFDPSRSLEVRQFFALLPPGLRLVSLQTAASAGEKSWLEAHDAVEAGSTMKDFDDTAAAVAAMDAVITVDTALAHLAGALAKPTVVLLNEPSAVRWMQRREDTPWYGSVRLLRKAGNEPWSALKDKLAKAVAP